MFAGEQLLRGSPVRDRVGHVMEKAIRFVSTVGSEDLTSNALRILQELETLARGLVG